MALSECFSKTQRDAFPGFFDWRFPCLGQECVFAKGTGLHKHLSPIRVERAGGGQGVLCGVLGPAKLWTGVVQPKAYCWSETRTNRLGGQTQGGMYVSFGVLLVLRGTFGGFSLGFFFEAGYYTVIQAWLMFALQPRLVLNSQQSFCFSPRGCVETPVLLHF